jgi:glucokinase
MVALLDVPTVYVSGMLVDVFGDPMLDRMHHEIELRCRLPNLRGLRTIEEEEPCPSLVGAAALTSVPRRV